MSRSIGLIALLVLAALAVVSAVDVTRPVRVEPAPAASAPESVAVAPSAVDAGSLDSLLDTVQAEHLLKHGR